MTIVNLPEILFSHSEMSENGQLRLTQAVAAGAKHSFSLPIQGDRVRFIYQWRIGNLTADVWTLNFRNIRNWDSNAVLLGTEQLNHPTSPFPFLIVKGSDGIIDVSLSAAAQAGTFEITLDYIDINYRFLPFLERYLGWKFKL